MLLSIITPTFKRLNYIKINYKYFLKNLHLANDYEWIIVVENTDFKSIAYVNSLKKINIKLLRGNFKSADKALYYGIRAAKGKYINFHGDDDFFYVGSLSKILKNLKSNYAWIAGYGKYINENFKEIRFLTTYIKIFLTKNYNKKMFILVNFLMTPSIFFRKDLFLSLKLFLPKKRSASDYIAWLKLNKLYMPKILNSPLTYCSIFKQTITGKFSIDKYLYIYKEQRKFSDKNKILIFLQSIFILIIIIYNLFSKKFNIKQ
jgi:hypothetical protein